MTNTFEGFNHQSFKQMVIRLLFLLFTILLMACQQSGDQAQSAASHQVATASLTVAAAVSHFEPPISSAVQMVFQSLDGGNTWQDITNGLPQKISPTTLYAQDGEIFLGTMNGIYSNRTVRPMPPVWEKEHLLDVLQHEFIATLMPAGGGVIARSHPSGFFQQIPGTGLWKPVFQELKRQEVNTQLTCADGSLFVTTNNGIFRSLYGAGQWGQVFAQGQVLSLVEVDGVLLGAGEIGVVRSTDGGNHWTWVLTEDSRSRKTLLIDDHIYAISMGGGTREQHQKDPLSTASKLSRSSDKGLTWERLDPQHLLGRRIYDLLPIDGALLCSTSSGIFKSTDQGKTWHLLRPTTSEKAIPSMAVDGPVIYMVEVFNGC